MQKIIGTYEMLRSFSIPHLSHSRSAFVKPLINIHRIIRLYFRSGSLDVQGWSRDPCPAGEWLPGNLELSDWVMGQYHVLLDGERANRRVLPTLREIP